MSRHGAASTWKGAFWKVKEDSCKNGRKGTEKGEKVISHFTLSSSSSSLSVHKLGFPPPLVVKPSNRWLYHRKTLPPFFFPYCMCPAVKAPVLSRLTHTGQSVSFPSPLTTSFAAICTCVTAHCLCENRKEENKKKHQHEVSETQFACFKKRKHKEKTGKNKVETTR